MTKDSCFYVGRIVKTHGIKGEVTLRIDNDDFDDIEELNYFLLDINDNLIPFFVENIGFHSNKAFVLFQDVKTLEAAHEVVDFIVVDDERGELGKVHEIIEYPTQSLIQIIRDDKEILIPIHDDIIKEVDRAGKKIYVKTPEGLIDMYLGN